MNPSPSSKVSKGNRGFGEGRSPRAQPCPGALAQGMTQIPEPRVALTASPDPQLMFCGGEDFTAPLLVGSKHHMGKQLSQHCSLGAHFSCTNSSCTTASRSAAGNQPRNQPYAGSPALLLPAGLYCMPSQLARVFLGFYFHERTAPKPCEHHVQRDGWCCTSASHRHRNSLSPVLTSQLSVFRLQAQP